MAKETMQAVSDAERSAKETAASTAEECGRLTADASEKAKQLVADTVKDARKKTEILYGVARADGEKQKLSTARETEEEQARLRRHAETCRGDVAIAIKKIILGQP